MDLEIFNAKYVALWSAIVGAGVGALISFFSVRAANKASLERLQVQLSADAEKAKEQRLHDAEQKREDRKAAIRRQVYIDAVDEVTKLLGYLGNLPQTDSAKEGATAMQPFLQATNKVWLVADSAAAVLARQLTSLFLEAYFRAIPRANEIHQLCLSLKSQEDLPTLSAEERASMFSRLQQLRLGYSRFILDECVQ